jgi:hypothetical protein
VIALDVQAQVLRDAREILSEPVRCAVGFYNSTAYPEDGKPVSCHCLVGALGRASYELGRPYSYGEFELRGRPFDTLRLALADTAPIIAPLRPLLARVQANGTRHTLTTLWDTLYDRYGHELCMAWLDAAQARIDAQVTQPA